MKKTIILFLALGGLMAAMNSCSKDDDKSVSDPTTHDEGVVINGVKWATRNIDALGTFATKPEDLGLFYQWNRKIAWATTGDVTDWDNTIPEGTEWTAANDPSPEGWRVPTTEEQQTLFNTEKVSNELTTQNGITGRKFTDKTTNVSLFLPAVGFRLYSTGILYSAGSSGNYWNSTQANTDDAYLLSLYHGPADWGDVYRKFGFSIRSVAK